MVTFIHSLEILSASTFMLINDVLDTKNKSKQGEEEKKIITFKVNVPSPQELFLEQL